MDVLQLWQLLEADTSDVWEWRTCYLIVTFWIGICALVGTEECDQSLQCR
uniref:Uncharacterized protein n=1 Tax=Setaria viridis TaxID=4556 RepID=A0A4U6TC08_SETVI|nr:hypothetical protein SEVIR_8G053140v2 [Setaria viridis]